MPYDDATYLHRFSFKSETLCAGLLPSPIFA